jgi:hypothetical protein
MFRIATRARSDAPLTHAALERAMRLNIISGSLGNMWITVCSTQPLFNVFLQNHLNATSATLGLLVGLMQLSGLFQLFSIFIYGNLRTRKGFFVAASLAHRVLGLVVAGAAFYVAAGGAKDRAVSACVTAIAISWCFTNISSSGWWSWVADIIPEHIRGSFFMKRSSIIQIVTVAWFFLATVMLDAFPTGEIFIVYGVIISIGAIAGILDILLNTLIPEPIPTVKAAAPAWKDFITPLRNRNFTYFSVVVGFVIFSMNLIGPFQAPYVTDPNSIGAPNTWLGVMTVISQMVWVLIAPMWGVVMDRYGRKPVVLLGCLLTTSWIGYLFLTSRNYVILLPLISLVAGFFGPAFWEGVNQMMLTLTPAENRVSYIAWYSAIVGAVSAFGSILGGSLRDSLSAVSIPVMSMHFTSFHIVQLAALAFVAVSMLFLNRIREGKEKPFGFVASQLVNTGLFRTFNSFDVLSKGPDSDQVAHALRSIEGKAGNLVLKEVIERLDDPSPEVREEAARALGRIRAPEAVDVLIQRLQNPESTIRIEAARALGRIGERRAVPTLAEGLLSPSPELKAACAEALGTIGDDEAIGALLAAFRTEQPKSVVVMGTEAASRQHIFANGENRLEIFEAAWEIFPRLLSTTNAVLRKQYAITIGNLLGHPGEFYQYITGDSAEQSMRIRGLFDRFRANLSTILSGKSTPGRAENLQAILEECAQSLENDDYKTALSDFFGISNLFMTAIFGKQAGAVDFFEYAMRMDMRLGTWCWLVRQSERLSDQLDAEVSRIVLLLGLYYLSQY